MSLRRCMFPKACNIMLELLAGKEGGYQQVLSVLDLCCC